MAAGDEHLRVPAVWRDLLNRQFGLDLTQVPGLGILAVFVFWTELGTNWARGGGRGRCKAGCATC